MTPDLDRLEQLLEDDAPGRIGTILTYDQLRWLISAARERDALEKKVGEVDSLKETVAALNEMHNADVKTLKAERDELQKHNQSLEMIVDGFQQEAEDVEALKAERDALRALLAVPLDEHPASRLIALMDVEAERDAARKTGNIAIEQNAALLKQLNDMKAENAKLREALADLLPFKTSGGSGYFEAFEKAEAALKTEDDDD